MRDLVTRARANTLQFRLCLCYFFNVSSICYPLLFNCCTLCSYCSFVTRLQIVEKAVWERKYCSLYAELCHRFALQVDIDAGDAQTQPQSLSARPSEQDEAPARDSARNTYLAGLSVRTALEIRYCSLRLNVSLYVHRHSRE